MLLYPANLLILDEPTNHLDMNSKDVLLDALKKFEGTVVFVSHDRYFIEKFATRVWELEGGVFTDYDCPYAEYHAAKAGAKAAAGAAASRAHRDKSKTKRAPDAQKATARLEREIAALEGRLAALSDAKEEFSTDYEKLLELGEEEAELNAELDAKYDAWLTADND
jgi:ABC-type multidrug transport system ATPase subunit